MWKKYAHHLVFIVLTVVYAVPLLMRWGMIGREDWTLCMIYNEFPVRSIFDFGQFPLWNPYHCGGTPYFANYHSIVLTPFLFLYMLFGGISGLKLSIIGHFIVGLYGAYYLARHFRIEKHGAIFSAAVYILSDWYTAHMAVGHLAFLPAVYTPWILLFYQKGLEDRRFSIGAGAVLSLVLYEGCPYMFSYDILLLVLFTIFNIFRSGFRNSLANGTIFTIFAFAFSAAKLLPAIELNSQAPRLINESCGFSILGFLEALFRPGLKLVYDGPSGWNLVHYGYWENSVYVGYISAVFFLIGAVKFGRRQWPLLTAFFVFLLLMIGTVPSMIWTPWAFLHKLPVFSSMRVAQRFLMIFIVFFALFSGMGGQWLYEKLGRFKFVFYVLAVIALVMFFRLDFKHYLSELNISPAWSIEDGTFRQKFGGDWSSFHAGHGDVSCRREPMMIRKAAIPEGRGDYRGEVFVIGLPPRIPAVAAGSPLFEIGGNNIVNLPADVQTVEWSPNRLRYRIDFRPDLKIARFLVVNQNYGDGWKERGGKKVVGLNGLLAVRLSPGDTEVDLVYLPASFIMGLVITLFGIAITAVVFISMRKNPRKIPEQNNM